MANEKSLGNGNNENHQAEHTKQLKETCCKNDNRTLRENGGCIKKAKTPSNLLFCQRKLPQRIQLLAKRQLHKIVKRGYLCLEYCETYERI